MLQRNLKLIAIWLLVAVIATGAVTIYLTRVPARNVRTVATTAFLAIRSADFRWLPTG